MSKEMNIGSMKLSIPEHDRDIGKALEQMQNAYEEGNITAFLTVYTTRNGVSSAVVGDGMLIPFVAMAAYAVAGQVIENIEDNLLGRQEGEED